MMRGKEKKMKNKLTTIQKTEVVLAKGKSLLGTTAKILSGSKALATTTTHKDVTIIGDLMWEKESSRMDWHDAMEYAKNLRQGGYDDWRLPTIEELKALVRECGAINTTLGDDGWIYITDKNAANELYQTNYKAKGFTSGNYWSSTTYAGNSDRTWYVYFYDGFQYDSPKTLSYYVRCVRAGQ
ncbi:MAG TPA: DUF1566 domain-containing protein [Epsilonproteobacteria bacterium]|nr:DUF1566 domain-containing protein [Campylobacterota bacterium]